MLIEDSFFEMSCFTSIWVEIMRVWEAFKKVLWVPFCESDSELGLFLLFLFFVVVLVHD